MEFNLSSTQEIFEEINKYLSSKPELRNDEKKPVFDYINKLRNDSEKKINMVFFGGKSSGKTTSINLLLEHLFTYKKNDKLKNIYSLVSSILPFKNISAKNSFFKFHTSQSENLYFFYHLENSEKNQYEIIIDINQEVEKEIFIESQICKMNFNEKGQIYETFPNSAEGLKKINDILLKIEKISKILFKYSEENKMNKTKLEIAEYCNPSLIIIKIPNFPKSFRLIDPPRQSFGNFTKNFVKIINNYNCINLLVFVQDILCEETYNMDNIELKKMIDEIGNCFIYSFYTKGQSFEERINCETTENLNNLPNYKENNIYFFNNIRKSKQEDVLFRKIIPIIDNRYENENVKKNIWLFFEDVGYILQKYGNPLYENTVYTKLRKNITDLLNKNATILLTTEEKSLLYGKKEIIIKHHKEKLNNYMQKFDNFENFKTKFPQYLIKLEETYKKNEPLKKSLAYFFDRKAYIEKHLEFSFEIFQKIVFKELEDNFIENLNMFSVSFDILKESKLNLELSETGLKEISESLKYKEEILNTFNFLFVLLTVLYMYISQINSLNKDSIFPTLILSGMGLFTLNKIYPLKNNYGLWSRETAREDVSRCLFEWLVRQKEEIIRLTHLKFTEVIEKCFEEIYNKKPIQNYIQELLNIIDKYLSKKINKREFQFQEDSLTDLIESECLKKFIKEVLSDVTMKN